MVERLRAAGAVILGKTNLSEWANIRSTKSSSGWSGRGGQTKNPYALDRNPCGSSSGTGSAIAANLAAVGVGTETDGSIVCPSSVAGLVGIKPTVGLVSRSGIIPISHSQDTAGPMTRTVTDAAVLLTAMTGVDPRDVATKASAGRAVDYAKGLDPGALKGARIGVARKRYFGYSPAADRVIDAAIAEMKARGATILDPADIPTASTIEECELDILLYEFKADLNAYLAGLGPSAKVKSLADVIAFNEREKAREMPFFGQELFVMAEKKGPLTSPAYRRALATCQARARALGIDAVMSRAALGCDRGTDGKPRLADRSPEWRSLPRRELLAGGRGRLSQHHRARRCRARAAGGPGVHGPQVERAQAHRACLCVRASHQAPAAAQVPGYRPGAVTVSAFFASFFRYLSYQARIRCSKSTLSATLFGGRWPPLT